MVQTQSTAAQTDGKVKMKNICVQTPEFMAPGLPKFAEIQKKNKRKNSKQTTKNSPKPILTSTIGTPSPISLQSKH